MFYNWIRVICRHVEIHDIIPNIIFYALLTLGKTMAPTQHKHDIKLIKYLICVHPSLVASENGQAQNISITTWETIIAIASHAQNARYQCMTRCYRNKSGTFFRRLYYTATARIYFNFRALLRIFFDVRRGSLSLCECITFIDTMKREEEAMKLIFAMLTIFL